MIRDLRYYLPGVTLILVAALIVAVPEILVALVSGLIVMAGIGALYIGHMVRKTTSAFDDLEMGFSHDGWSGWRYFRLPVFRSRYREF